MTTKRMIQATLTIAGALLCAATAYADKPSWCTNGVLMETRSFSDGGEARDFANAQSATATVNGATQILIGTVNVVKAPVGNLVYVVQVWYCPSDPPPPVPGPGAGNNGNNNNGAPGKPHEKVTYTLDPHPELDRNGKPRK